METIKQRSLSVIIHDATGDRSVRVRRLSWKAAKSFYADLARVFAQLFAAPRSKGDTPREPTPEAPQSSFLAKLPELILQSDTLVADLLTHTTALTAAEIDALDYGDVLSLIASALAVNLDEEIKNSCAGVVAQIRGFYAAAPAATATRNAEL